MPELDSDGDILFKKEGMKYHVAVSDIDTSPMYVVLFHNYRYDDTYTKNKILSVLNEVNLYKAVKLLCFDAAYSFRAEMYLVDAEQFKYTFYKLMSQLASMEDELENYAQVLRRKYQVLLLGEMAYHLQFGSISRYMA